MKFKKKTAMLVSFTVGTMLFATTAFAEVASKSGYDQLKDSLKFTAESCTTKLSSYTADISFVIKDNGKAMISHNIVAKRDSSNKASESISKNVSAKGTDERYSYSDEKGYLTKANNENVYHLTEYATPQNGRDFKNPFKEKEAGDIERIADALIGNLKDSVVVTENADGSKQLSGTLNESQIPALVNALVSFQSKNMLNRNSNSETKDMPKLAKDIIIKEVKGKMSVSKDGLIESVFGTGIVSGKDETGQQHNLTFELLGKISNINSTILKKPDLSGKKVDKIVQRDHSKLSNPEKYVGKYKTDILIEKDNKFEKIGERFIDVEQLNDKTVTGKYHEEFVKGYEDYASDNKELKFSGNFNDKKDAFGCEITATNASGKKLTGHIFISPQSPRINFDMNGISKGTLIYDGEFNKIFN